MSTTHRPKFDTPQDAVDWLRASGVTNLCSDSREVEAGDAFIAWPGYAVDARAFVQAALIKGAVAVLVEAQGVEDSHSALPTKLLGDSRIAFVSNLKALCGEIAAIFYAQPSQDLSVVAITGTNGKTSISWWLAQALSAAGSDCGVMGTLGVGRLSDLMQTGLTTPDPIRVQSSLRSMADSGAVACAMEASSIGLEEKRLNGTAIRVAVFSNLSQDHLDYHGSMANYWQAKQALFKWPGLSAAVVNTDDAHGRDLLQTLPAHVTAWAVGVSSSADRNMGSHNKLPAATAGSDNMVSTYMGAMLLATNVHMTASGTSFDVSEYSAAAVVNNYSFDLPIAGLYNVSNMLCVLASMRALGIELAQAGAACIGLRAVPGRMEAVDAGRSDIQVWVDYAHTPDAVAQALQALRPMTGYGNKRLWCVLGCGGDRDTSKRASMAEQAVEHADAVVFTSDNPRSEDPHSIVEQLMVAALAHGQAPSKLVLQQVERAQAIAMAVATASPGDVILIAGKGHENYQEIGGVRMPFSDVQVASAALRTLRASTSL